MNLFSQLPEESKELFGRMVIELMLKGLANEQAK